MLARIAASLLSIALLAPTANARAFAQPPTAPATHERVARRPGIDRAALIAALAQRREQNLAGFRAYRKGGVYPKNDERSGPLNIWRDRAGHLCAAATMIDRDGQHALVSRVATRDNHIRLLDVTDGPLLDWILTSGFTLEEIDRIQLPMPGPNQQEQRDQQWARDEHDRMTRDYFETDRFLVQHRDAGLAIAADRLMDYPALARQLIASTRTS